MKVFVVNGYYLLYYLEMVVAKLNFGSNGSSSSLGGLFITAYDVGKISTRYYILVSQCLLYNNVRKVASDAQLHRRLAQGGCQ